MEVIHKWASFGGEQKVFRHESKVLNSTMEFGVYCPPVARHQACPVLIFLSGLTCTWANFVEKAGSQNLASKFGMIVITPDTSPRGKNVKDVDRYDLGQGAGFYLNATRSPWAEHYQMYSYVMEEVPSLIQQWVPQADLRRVGVMGHSMGGHGALVMAFREPTRFQSVSAFAPICAPSLCDWGRKAFSEYLGEDQSLWQEYDASLLATKTKWNRRILIDQGEKDQFLASQLHPSQLEVVCKERGLPLQLRMQKDYDHSYFFIASFLADHFAHHHQFLGSME